MSSKLFSEFDPVSAKQWKQKIQFDLKGADYNDALVWESPEGIHVKPFYHREDLQDHGANIPGQPSTWLVTQRVYIDDVDKATRLMSNALDRGAEAILLSAHEEFDISSLLDDINLADKTLYFDLSFLSSEFFLNLMTYCQQRSIDAQYGVDILGNLAKSGNWFHNLKEDHALLEQLVAKSPAKTLAVHMDVFQNAGANIVQQLAYGLAQCTEYLNHFQRTEKLGMMFHVAVGNNYFFEIAKIRALRILYQAVASEFGLAGTCEILATPSRRNKTLYDYNVNMLRTTTECMSAVLGGANAVCNNAYDALYHKSNEFGERISRNQLLILRAESYFDSVSNPADGAYYIEKLTDELAQRALVLFKSIEAGGGFLKQLKEGVLQKKIKESAAKEQALFDNGTRTLVGTNKFANDSDRMKDNLELYPFVKTKPRKTLLEPIIEKRISETIEKERLEHE